PLPLGEDGVEGKGGLAGSRHARHHRDPVMGDVERHVLQIVLPGSLDAEPQGLGHSTGPPEMESLPDAARAEQPAAPATPPLRLGEPSSGPPPLTSRGPLTRSRAPI